MKKFILINLFTYLVCHASIKHNNSVGANQQVSDQNVGTVSRSQQLNSPSSYPYDLSIIAPCKVCKKKTKTYCSRCKKAFYCSRECQKKNSKSHKNDCNRFIKNRKNKTLKKFEEIAKSYTSSKWEYHPKSQQRLFVYAYVRHTGSEYNLVILNKIKRFIFLMYYDLAEENQFKIDLKKMLQANHWTHVMLNERSPMYLIKFLQYVYSKEKSSKQSSLIKKKKCYLFHQIANTYWQLGFYYSFDLQKKMIVASIKYIEESDYQILQDRSFSRIAGSWALSTMITKGVEKAVKYSSVAGWYNLANENHKSLFSLGISVNELKNIFGNLPF